MSIRIVSPNISITDGGVERFAHDLAKLLQSDYPNIDVVPPGTDVGSATLISNGMVSGNTKGKHIHVFHGCWIPHMRASYSLTVDGFWLYKRMLLGAFKEITAAKSAITVAVSDQVAREISTYYKKKVDKVIPNFVLNDSSHLWQYREDREDFALFVGRAEKRKSPELAQAVAKNLDIPLYHVGSGQISGTKSLGVLGRGEIEEVMNKASFLISSSNYEGNSLSILEALAIGLPVVATLTGWTITLARDFPMYQELLAERGSIEDLTKAAKFALSPGVIPVMKNVTKYFEEQMSSRQANLRWRSLIEE